MRVKLSRDAWHYRLQMFVWGSAPQHSICPYFWSTVFATLLFPLACMGALIKPKMYPDELIPQEEWVEQNGYDAYRRMHGNAEVGFEVGIGTLFFLVITLGPLALMGILVAAVGESIGLALALPAVVVPILVVFGIYKSREIWIPFLWSIKDAVCPMIEWQE